MYTATRFQLVLPERPDRVRVTDLTTAFEKLGNEAMHLTLGNDMTGLQRLTGVYQFVNEAAVPANPPAGEVKMYSRGGILYQLDSAGLEQQLPGGGSVGGSVFEQQNVTGNTITLPATPVGVFGVYINGQALMQRDWTIAGAVITLLTQALAGDDVHVEYFVDTLGLPPPLNLWTDNGTNLLPVPPTRGIDLGGNARVVGEVQIPTDGRGVSLNGANRISAWQARMAFDCDTGGYDWRDGANGNTRMALSAAGALTVNGDIISPVGANVLINGGAIFFDWGTTNTHKMQWNPTLGALELPNSSLTLSAGWLNITTAGAGVHFGTGAGATGTYFANDGNWRFVGAQQMTFDGLRFYIGPAVNTLIETDDTSLYLRAAGVHVMAPGGGYVSLVAAAHRTASNMSTYAFEAANVAAASDQGYANTWVDASAMDGKSNVRALEHDPLAIVNDPTLHAVSYDVPTALPPPDGDLTPGGGKPPGFGGKPLAVIPMATQVGFIADDWLPVLPEVVSVVDGRVMGMTYGRVTAIVFEALKQYIAQTDARLAALEGTP
jgi:hypothetical protein